MCRLCASHLKLVKGRDTNRATHRETPNKTKQTQPNHKRRQGSYLKKADAAENAVKQSNLGAMNSALALNTRPPCAFHVFLFGFLRREKIRLAPRDQIHVGVDTMAGR